MGKRLVITEKPSVARDICAVLGGFADEEEYFENEDFVVTFAVGHLLELAEPEDYDKSLRAWTITSLPIIPEAYKIKPKDGQKKRLDLIRKLGRRKDVDGLVNACDAGREGEVIFRRIQEYTGLDDRPHQRLWLQSMTPDAIREAFAHLRAGGEYDHLADAAWLRGVGDWLIGMNATRALTKRLKGRNEPGAWSAGRVQTPTLGLLVAREREILAHRPRTYWEIVAALSRPDHAWEGRYHDPSVTDAEDRDIRPSRIFDRARVDEVLAAAQAADEGVASERRKKSKQGPPLPFDLTSLQREANRRFTFSAKRTLNAAQRLYETHKLLTYPRTDSRHLPKDYGTRVAEAVEALTHDVAYRALALSVVQDGPQNLERILDDAKVSDHFAIVPTGAEPPADLSGDDARIYDLVVRQFLAALMGPATWATVERQVEVPVAGGRPAIFRTTARTLEVPGFLAALGLEEGAGTELPPLVPGRDSVDGVPVAVGEVVASEKETRPPSHYAESQLLRLMETAGELVGDDELAEVMNGRGLGTPATRADIIERLIQTAYVRRVDGKLAPTPKGIRLMDILERAHVPVLASARLTGQWEHALQQVQDGALPRAQALANLERFTREVTASLTGFEHDALFAADGSLGGCPSCGEGVVVESAWGYRCSRNTQKDPACRLMIWKERGGRYIDRDLARRLLADHRSGLIEGFVDRAGRGLSGEIFLEPEDKAPGAPWTMRVVFGDTPEDAGGPEVAGEVVFPCPCGESSCAGVVETNRRFVCQRVLEGVAKQGPVLPKVVCSRPMEAEEVGGYFSPEGKTGFIEGFTSKRGRPFTGLLFRKPTGKHGFEFPPRPGDAEGGKRRGRRGDAPAPEEKPAGKSRRAPRVEVAAAEAPATKRARGAAKKAPGDASAAKKAATRRSPAKKPSTKRAAGKRSPADDAPSDT